MTQRHRIIGGTKAETVLFSPEGEERYRKRVPTPKGQSGTYAAIRDTVCNLIRHTIDHIEDSRKCTIGIGIPGIVDLNTGLIQNANTTGLIGKPFKKDVEKSLGRSVGMENDANCFTLAESLGGAGTGYRIVVGIIMGSGCGGGICMDGRLHHGRHGIAGEWGHFSIDPEGSKCFCGNHGCIERKISGTGVEHAFYKKHKEHLPMVAIVRGAREGEPRCVTAFNQFLDDFGRCLGGLISILDPDAVVLGGGLSNIDELYSQGVDRVRHYAFHPHIQTPILKNKLGDSAGVYGAAWIGT